MRSPKNKVRLTAIVTSIVALSLVGFTAAPQSAAAETNPAAEAAGELPRGADGQPLESRFRDRDARRLDRQRRRVRRPAGQGRHGHRARPRHAQRARRPVLDRRLRSPQSDAAARHAHLGAVQGHAALRQLSRRRRLEPRHARRAGAPRHEPGDLRSARATTPKRSSRWSSICGRIVGKEIFIRLVDASSGGWGHINFDDFRLHATQARVSRRRASNRSPTTIRSPGCRPKKRPRRWSCPRAFA